MRDINVFNGSVNKNNVQVLNNFLQNANLLNTANVLNSFIVQVPIGISSPRRFYSLSGVQPPGATLMPKLLIEFTAEGLSSIGCESCGLSTWMSAIRRILGEPNWHDCRGKRTSALANAVRANLLAVRSQPRREAA